MHKIKRALINYLLIKTNYTGKDDQKQDDSFADYIKEIRVELKNKFKHFFDYGIIPEHSSPPKKKKKVEELRVERRYPNPNRYQDWFYFSMESHYALCRKNIRDSYLKREKNIEEERTPMRDENTASMKIKDVYGILFIPKNYAFSSAEFSCIDKLNKCIKFNGPPLTKDIKKTILDAAFLATNIIRTRKKKEPISNVNVDYLFHFPYYKVHSNFMYGFPESFDFLHHFIWSIKNTFSGLKKTAIMKKVHLIKFGNEENEIIQSIEYASLIFREELSFIYEICDGLNGDQIKELLPKDVPICLAISPNSGMYVSIDGSDVQRVQDFSQALFTVITAYSIFSIHWGKSNTGKKLAPKTIEYFHRLITSKMEGSSARTDQSVTNLLKDVLYFTYYNSKDYLYD